MKDKKIQTAKAIKKNLQLSFLRGETNKAAFSFSLSYFPKLNSLCQKDWKIQFQIDKTFFQSPLQLSWQFIISINWEIEPSMSKNTLTACHLMWFSNTFILNWLKAHPLSLLTIVQSLDMNKDPFHRQEEDEQIIGSKVTPTWVQSVLLCIWQMHMGWYCIFSQFIG